MPATNLSDPKRNKVVILGIDGATFDMYRWADQRVMPNLYKIMSDGSKGRLESVTPPFSATAWTSFITGKNPGKHGVFDFRYSRAVDPNRPFTSSRSIKSSSLWKILSNYGFKVGIVNVPMTYPPERVNGFIMANTLTASMGEDIFYPSGLYGQLRHLTQGYDLELNWDSYDHKDPSALTSDVTRLSQKQAEIALYCMDSLEWDFFILVLTGIDRIQHFIWKYVDSCHPLFDKRESDRYLPSILSCYQEIDKILGKFYDRLNDRTDFFVISDHGFGPQHKTIFLNRWLINLGLLKFHRRWFAGRQLLRRLDVFQFRERLSRGAVRKIRSTFNLFKFVDWSKTMAYSGTPSEQGIYINLKGREPAGIIEPGNQYETLRNFLVRELHKLKDPESGRKVIKRVLKREEIYEGPYLEWAPDLTIVPEDTFNSFSDTVDNQNVLAVSEQSGSHRKDGILIATGKDIKGGIELNGCKLIDVVPTVLYLYGLGIPEDIDGKVLTDLFEESFIKEHPIRYTKKSYHDVDQGPGNYNTHTEHTDEIAKRLKGLGYL